MSVCLVRLNNDIKHPFRTAALSGGSCVRLRDAAKSPVIASFCRHSQKQMVQTWFSWRGKKLHLTFTPFESIENIMESFILAVKENVSRYCARVGKFTGVTASTEEGRVNSRMFIRTELMLNMLSADGWIHTVLFQHPLQPRANYSDPMFTFSALHICILVFIPKVCSQNALRQVYQLTDTKLYCSVLSLQQQFRRKQFFIFRSFLPLVLK